ncbi:uncharacterized protein LOC125810127 [Solanum verrucosum]|uniref:uncharacterized protein LOC125810127 n=1 Tax=Solanum verrucosum TaxID=315347 RepID=UPI0020D11905|nr:uncharacterized protein LOC125810127 [Solanum verrucosum]
MEFFSNHLSFFFLVLTTLLSSCQIHARDNQFFNKIHTTNINNDHIEKETKVVVTPNKNQEPNFIPKNENAYGVYGHELGQLPPSTRTTNLIPNNKYLPKNYNSVAYVTVPQYNTDETNTMNSNNQRYNSGRGISSDHDHYYIGDNTYNNNDNNNNNEYYINGNTYDHYYKSDNNDDNNNNNNQYYNSVNTYNDQYHNGGKAGSKVMTTSTESYLNGDGREYYYIKKDQLQDMNEPRLMDKGYATATSYKNGGNNFYYNNQEQSPNTKKYVKNPYEKSREFANSYIGNNELSNNNNNNFVNYENDEEHMP